MEFDRVEPIEVVVNCGQHVAEERAGLDEGGSIGPTRKPPDYGGFHRPRCRGSTRAVPLTERRSLNQRLHHRVARERP